MATFAARQLKFKQHPAKEDVKISFVKLKQSVDSSCTGRLESILLKLDPTHRYSIGVLVFSDGDGRIIRFSGTGRKIEQLFTNLQIDEIYDINHVKVECKTLTHQYSWMIENDFELLSNKDTDIIQNLMKLPVNFPRMGYQFKLLSSLGEFPLHVIFDCFGYVTDLEDMSVDLNASDTYLSNAKMTITIADENGVRLVIENMGNFRKQWPTFGIHTDNIIKVKGLELKARKEVEEGEFPIWIAHAFDDTIFRVDAQLPEAQPIYHLINDPDPPAEKENLPMSISNASEDGAAPMSTPSMTEETSNIVTQVAAQEGASNIVTEVAAEEND